MSEKIIDVKQCGNCTGHLCEGKLCEDCGGGNVCACDKAQGNGGSCAILTGLDAI